MGIDIDYKTRNDLVKNSIIIMTPAQKLTSWSLHSGNIYKKTITRYPENMQRNGIDLNLVASIALVTDSTKYYYANNMVYIYTPTTDYLTMFFNLYFGDRGHKLPKDLDLEGSADIAYFEPRIQNNPSFTKEQKDKMQGIAITGDASFDIIDTENDYTEKITELLEDSNYSFVDKDVRIYRYLSEENPVLIQKVFRGNIYDWQYDRKKISFSAKDFMKKFESFVQDIEYNIIDYPYADPSFVDKVIRFLYGTAKIRAVNIDYVSGGSTSDNRIWKLTNHANKSIDEVWIKDTLLTITTHYTLNADKNQITLIDNLEAVFGWDTIPSDEKVYALVQGKKDGLGNLIDNASDIVKDILLQIGFEADDLNLTSFADAKTDNTYSLGIALPQYVDGERPQAREIIEKINASVLGFLTLDNDFKIRFDIYQEGTASINLDKNADLIGRRINATVENLASTIIIDYDFDEMLDRYISKSIVDEDALYLHENYKSHTIESCLTSEVDALALAGDYSSYYKNPVIYENFSIKLQLDDKIIGDFINIDNNKCEILKIDKSIESASLSCRRV